MIKSWGLRYTFPPGPFMDLSPGAVDSDVRDSTLKRFLAVTEVAGLINAKCVVFHSGYEKWKYDHSIEPWLGNSLKFWPEVIKAAKEAGTRIAIENIFEEDPGSLKLLMEGLDTSVAGICFDTGHFNIFTRLPLKTWMDELRDYIIELHLHDNKGDRDSHLPPGEGTFDFRELFELLEGRDVIHTIEANSPEETILSIERLNLHV
jgi:sugar phosphate isomerase/epimerase